MVSRKSLIKLRCTFLQSILCIKYSRKLLILDVDQIEGFFCDFQRISGNQCDDITDTPDLILEKMTMYRKAESPLLRNILIGHDCTYSRKCLCLRRIDG